MFFLGVTIGAIPVSLPVVYGLNAVSYVLSLIAIYLFIQHRRAQIWQSVSIWFIGVGVGSLSLAFWRLDPQLQAAEGALVRLGVLYLVCVVVVLISMLPELRREPSLPKGHDAYEAIRNSICRLVWLPVPVSLIAFLFSSLGGPISQGMVWLLTFILIELVIGLRACKNRWAGLAAVSTPASLLLGVALSPTQRSFAWMVELMCLGVVLLLGTIWALRMPKTNDGIDRGTGAALDQL